jgi:hypothetical protein
MSRIAVCLIVVLAVAACGKDPEADKPPPVTVDGPISGFPKLAKKIEGAQAAARLLSTRLLAKMQETVSEGGPLIAIDVCRDVAPRIAREVGDETGFRIGRTSHRLRNPENRPPAWAADVVKKIARGDPEAGREPRVFVRTDGVEGITLPITMQKMCVTCHGTEEQIPAKVRELLAEHYPEDRAREFRPGDLRGLVWVEWRGKKKR